MNSKAALALGALLAVCVISGSCSRTSNGAERSGAVSGQPRALPEVEVTRVISQKLSATVRLPAQLTPYEVVEVYPKVTGFLKWIKVDRGSRVKDGEPIAQLEAPELVAQRAEAESKFESAESQLAAAQAKLSADQATYQRMRGAAKTPGVVAPNDLEVAQKTAQSDQATVSAAEKTAQAARAASDSIAQLQAYLNITAPFDGQVTTRYVHPGALVGPQGGSGAMTPIVQIQTVTRHRLVVPVPEYDAAGIPEGMEVNFTVPSFPGKVFRAPIARISHAVDVKTRTMPVELDVTDPHAELDPGTFCEVEWPVRRAYATLFVPASAVATDLERSFVIRIRDGHAEWVDVKTGAVSGNRIEVFGDLKEEDEVATRGTDQLRSGAEVNPRFASSP
ncbi:MAG TPA: efflux RND transporter periplasmic adaptor subunit [Terriglobia bacterium]|nr:efflux RND transporter periplasmic adaptor subunit [Terriglobia bacterium]